MAGSGSSRSAEKLEVTPLPRLCVENITSFEGDCHGGDKLLQGFPSLHKHDGHSALPRSSGTLIEVRIVAASQIVVASIDRVPGRAAEISDISGRQ